MEGFNEATVSAISSRGAKVHTFPALSRYVSQNVGSTDRQLRTAIGALFGIGSFAILAGVGSLPPLLSPVLGVLALVLLGTAATGTCGLYSVLGVNTCTRQSESPR